MHILTEILDQIFELFEDSPSDLARCCLVCKDWYPPARRRSFYSVNMCKPLMADLVASYSNLIATLKANPAYVDMVHELVIQWTPIYAAKLVSEVSFTKIQSVVFKNIAWNKKDCSSDIMDTFKAFLHLPSVERVSFVDVTFHDAWDALFEQCGPNIKSLGYSRTYIHQGVGATSTIADKVALESLSLFRGTAHRVVRLLNSAEVSPFDLGKVRYLKYDLARTPGATGFSTLLNAMKDSLQTLEIYVPLFDEKDSELVEIDIGPKTLPVLTCLTLCHLVPDTVQGATRFILQLDSESRVHTIHLDVPMFNDYDVATDKAGWKNALESLDDALSFQLQAPLVKNGNVLIKWEAKASSSLPETIVQFWKELLPQVSNKGLLTVSLAQPKRWIF